MKIKEIRLESKFTETILSPFDPNYNVLPELNRSQKLMMGYVICFIFRIPESSVDMYFQSEPLFVDSKVSIVFHQFDRSRMPQSLRNSPDELTVTREMLAGWPDRYSVNGLQVPLSQIEELRRLFHLGPVKYITHGRIVEVMRMSADQRLRFVEEAAGIGSIKKDIASERQHLVQMMTDWSRIKASLLAIDLKRETITEQHHIFNKWKAEVQRLKRLRIAYDYNKLLDEENELKRSLSSMNKKIDTCKANIVKMNEQMEASRKKLKAMTAEEPTVIEEDKNQTAYYEAACLLFYNQREIDVTNALLSMGQEDEVRLKKHAEEIGVAEEDAKRKLTEEQTRLDRLQESLDVLRAAVSNDLDNGWACATKILKGEGPEKIATAVCLEYTSNGFHVTIGEHKENIKDMEKLKLSLSDLQNNCDAIQEKSRAIDRDLEKLSVDMNKWKESVSSLSLIVRDIKKKFPKLDPDPHKAQAAQIAARGKLEGFMSEKSTILMQIIELMDRWIEECKTETDLKVSVNDEERRLHAIDSHMKSLVAPDPWITQEQSKFGKRNSLYDFLKDDPETALEHATALERERKFNGVAVMTDINEIYARSIKEELDLTAESKKIEGESSACEQKIGVLEKKLLTSIAEFQEDFKAVSSQILPQRKSLELVMGAHHLDVRCEGRALNLALFDKEAHLLCVLLQLLSGNPNQASITFLDMVDSTLDATDINLMKNVLINKFPNHQFISISGKPGLHGIPVELEMNKPRTLSLPSSQQLGGKASLQITM